MRRLITLGRELITHGCGLRRMLSWKFVFYDLILPVLRGARAVPGRRDLGSLGWLAIVTQPQAQQAAKACARAGQRGT